MNLQFGHGFAGFCRLHTFPELVVHGHGVVRAPEEATALDLHEVQHVLVAPGLGGHAGCTTSATHQHALGDIVVGVHRGTPGRHACVTQLGHVADGGHHWAGAGCGAVLHTADRGAARTNLAEVQDQHRVALVTTEGHVLHLLQSLGPTFTAVRHLKDFHVAIGVQMLGGTHVQRIDFARLAVLVHHVDHADRHGQAVQVSADHFVVVGATDTRAVQQQVEGQEGRGCGRAVREHFHVAGRLSLVAVLQVAARHQDRCLAQVVAHLVELEHPLTCQFGQMGALDLGVQHRAAGCHAMGNVFPLLDFDVADHVQQSANDQVVAIFDVVGLDDDVVRAAPFIDFAIQSHVVTAGNLDGLDVGLDRASDLAVDGSIRDGITDTFGVNSCGGKRRLAHGAPCWLWFLKKDAKSTSVVTDAPYKDHQASSAAVMGVSGLMGLI